MYTMSALQSANTAIAVTTPAFLCDVGTNPSTFPCKMRSYEYIAALNHWSSTSPCAVARPHFLVSVQLVKHFGIMAEAFGENMLGL